MPRRALYAGSVPELKPVYLLGGSDRPKIQRALRRLRARVGEDAVELLSASESSGGDAVGACNALGLFAGGRRLVIVEHVEAWKAADHKLVASYLADPAPETVLALWGEGAKADSTLAKTCKKHGDVLVYDVSKKALPRWVADQFDRLGAQADAPACQALVELVGDDLDALTGEIEKLAAWAGGEPIREREVELVAVGLAEAPPFALTDAWGRRDVAGVLAACESTLERTPGPRRDELPRLAGRLGTHIGRVRECQAYAFEGVRPSEAASQMRRAPYYVQKLFAQAENFTPDELRGVVVRMADLDLALKGGSKLPGDLELERMLIEITRRVEERPA